MTIVMMTTASCCWAWQWFKKPTVFPEGDEEEGDGDKREAVSALERTRNSLESRVIPAADKAEPEAPAPEGN
jgi:hypothetical protein